MNLLQKFISLILVQLFALFLINPLFAVSNGDNIVVSSIAITDTCGKNIQCYEVGNNKYTCSQTETGINPIQGYTSNIQIGKNDISSYCFLTSINEQKNYFSSRKNQFYKDPEGDIYPFVGIIKIQV